MSWEKKAFPGGKTAALWPDGDPASPLILVNGFEEETAPLREALAALGASPCHLLAVGGLDWNRDLSPWEAPAAFRGEEPFSGGADAHLHLLLEEVIPWADARIGGEPAWRGIAGYSLAGLFALYALYRCGSFRRAASVSGSLWFPGFRAFAETHAFACEPDGLYLSVGDREERTRNPMLRPVRENMEALAAHWRRMGIPVTSELNPGNHFQDAVGRLARGIRAMLSPAGRAAESILN